MPTTVIKSIKAGGGGDYTSLASWWTARQGNIVTRDTIEVAEVYGGGSVGGLNMDTGDATVDATHYFIVRAATGEGHVGVFDTAKAYVQASSGNTFRCLIAGTQIKRLQIESTDASTGEQSLGAAGDDMLVEDCLIRNANGYALRVFPRTANHWSTFKSCVIYTTGGGQDCIDVGGNGFGNTASICAKFYNCVGVQFSSGKDTISTRGSSPTADVALTQNSYWYNVDGGSRNYGGSHDVTKGDHDATNDTEAVTVGLRSIALNTSTFTNVSYATFDAHEPNVSSPLYHAGTDLTGIVDEDFEGDARVGQWDIGADQIPGVTRTLTAPIAVTGSISSTLKRNRNLSATVTSSVAFHVGPLYDPDGPEAPENISRIKSDGTLDYTTLQAWYEARKGNLVTRGVREVAEVYGGGSVGELLMGFQTYAFVKDSTTNSQYYFVIRAARGQDHGGKYDVAKAYVNAATDNAFWCGIPFTRIGPGISTRSSANIPEIAGNPHGVLIAEMGAGEYCVVDGLISIVDGGSCFRAEYCDGATETVFRNCVAQHFPSGSPSVGFRATNATIGVYNCVSWSGDFATEADNDAGAFGHPAQDGIITTQNCYLLHADCYNASGGGSHINQGSKDFTSSAQATDPSRRNIDPTTVGWTNSVQDTLDTRLTGGSVLIAAGANLSADFSEDYQRNGRPALFDVGPDQLVGERDFSAPVGVSVLVGSAMTRVANATFIAHFAAVGRPAVNEFFTDAHFPGGAVDRGNLASRNFRTEDMIPGYTPKGFLYPGSTPRPGVTIRRGR